MTIWSRSDADIADRNGTLSVLREGGGPSATKSGDHTTRTGSVFCGDASAGADPGPADCEPRRVCQSSMRSAWPTGVVACSHAGIVCAETLGAIIIRYGSSSDV